MSLLVESEDDGARAARGRRGWWIAVLGIFGAALLYGDGMITPAISVLSAVEGLEVVTPGLGPWVAPLAVAILVGLFAAQHAGTARVGRIFGPAMLVWFVSIGALGGAAVVRRPEVLAAFNPVHGLRFLLDHGFAGFLVLGLVFLVATGSEALYADIGHFGKRPVRVGWFCVVAVSLLLSYFGQGALLLADPGAAENPFYRLAPSWLLYPLVALAAAATVIASQAVISGVFSLTLQSVHLDYLPRLRIEHTSERHYGQIYVPAVNWLLLAATVALVLGFQRSGALAAAYGVAVASTMVITDLLLYGVMRRLWRWSVAACLGLSLLFTGVDLAFMGANALKIAEGGWLALAVAAALSLVMTTWRRGREILGERIEREAVELDDFLAEVDEEGPPRVPGTAVYLTGHTDRTPMALLHNFRHNHVLHERLVLLTLVTRSDVPWVRGDRFSVHRIRDDLHRALVFHGFKERARVRDLLDELRERDLPVDPETTHFFVGREVPLPREGPGMALWREKLFAGLTRLSQQSSDYFETPAERTLELGARVEI